MNPAPATTNKPKRRFRVSPLEIGLLLLLLAIVVVWAGPSQWAIKMTAQTNNHYARLIVDSIPRLTNAYKTEVGKSPPSLEDFFEMPPELRAKIQGRAYAWVVERKKMLPDAWGHAFVYRQPGIHNKDRFDFFSVGPDSKADTADDIGNW